MAEIIREITVDVAKANVFQAIVAKQFDSNSRFLKATIKEYLKYCKTEIEKRINDLGLILNHKKTQLFSLAQPIKFLGFTFRLTNTGKVVCKLIPNKVSHERRKLKKLVSRAKQGLMTKEQVDECFKSWKAHASFGDTYTLISNMETYYKNLWR